MHNGSRWLIAHAALLMLASACSSSSTTNPSAASGGADGGTDDAAADAAAPTCTGTVTDGGKSSSGFAFGNSVYDGAGGGFSTRRGSADAKARGTISMFEQNGACTDAAGTFGTKQAGEAATLTSQCAPHCCPCAQGPRSAVVSMVIDGKCAAEADACATAMRAAPENVDTLPVLANFCGANCDEP